MLDFPPHCLYVALFVSPCTNLTFHNNKIRFILFPGTSFTLTLLFVGNFLEDLEILHFEEHDDRSIEARFLILLLLRLNSCVFHPSPNRWGIRCQNRMASQSNQACKLVEAVAGILLDLAVLVLLKIKHFEMRIREPLKKIMKVWKIPHWGLTPSLWQNY